MPSVVRRKMAVPLVLALAGTAAAAGVISWRSDLELALSEARRTGKLVLVNVHTSWCGPCRRLQATTLADPMLAEMIEESCVPVSLDGDEEAARLVSWGVTGFPTQLFLDGHGKEVGRIAGYVTSTEYAQVLQRAIDATALARRPAPARLGSDVATLSRHAAPSQGVIERRQTEGRLLDRAPRRPLEDPAVRPCDASAPLALDGYCPVSMITRAELVQGANSECIVYRGLRYHFLSARERLMFLDDPARFLPAADGKCVVTWAEKHLWMPGRIKYPAIFGDHVFLFPTDQERQKFLVDPEKYVDAAGHVRDPLTSAGRDSAIH